MYDLVDHSFENAMYAVPRPEPQSEEKINRVLQYIILFHSTVVIPLVRSLAQSLARNRSGRNDEQFVRNTIESGSKA
jgi:hypothetical protein